MNAAAGRAIQREADEAIDAMSILRRSESFG